MPAALADRAPQIVERDDGRQVWRLRGRRLPEHRAQRGRRPAQGRVVDGAGRFDEMRRGCWDIDARIADMDLAGIWASLCFPSLIAGFCGPVFSQSEGPRARASPACGRGTTGTSRCGPAPTRTASSRCRSPGCPTRSVAADERARQRRARLPGRELRRDARQARPAVAAHRALGSVPRRLRGDRHRRLPAHRLGVVGADPRATTRLRAAPDAVPGERLRRGRRLAVVGRPRALPRAATSPCPRAASAG